MSTTTKGADWSISWPTDEQLTEALEGSSYRKLATKHNVDRTTIANHVKGRRKQSPGQPVLNNKRKHSNTATPGTTIEVNKDSANAEFTEQTLDPNKVPTDEELVRKANLSPDVWEVVSRRTSVWEVPSAEGDVQTMRSFRVSFGRRKDSPENQILPAFGGRPVSVKPPARRKATQRDTELVVVMSDFHCPHFDPALLEVSCQLMREIQPDRLIVNGDVVDWGSVSRHGKERNQASANECIQSAGEVLGKLRASVPADCLVQFVPGNHDRNLSQYLLERAGEAIDLCVAGSDIPVWSLQSLLRFDELGIQMIGSEDQWQHASVQLTDHLIVRHGHSVRAGSASSVLANMQKSEFASLTGHTHRMGIATKTVWRADGSHLVLEGAEVGGMFKMPEKSTDWPTYIPHSSIDWAPGFATVEIVRAPKGEAGHFSVDLASWQNSALMWRGNYYKA